MTAAVDALNLAPMDREELMDYLDRAARAMVNAFDNDSNGRVSLL
jgi:truncated hemoglobin YjbI